MNTAALSLGANIGDRLANIRRAVALVSERAGHIAAVSDIYETPPWGPVDQPRFLNACALLETELPPYELLSELQDIERAMGRVRRERWGPREIDIDILTYGTLAFDDNHLTIPHPRMFERAFVLLPLSDILPDLKSPSDGVPVRELLERVDCRGIMRITGF